MQFTNKLIVTFFIFSITLFVLGCSSTPPAEQIEGSYSGNYTDTVNSSSGTATLTVLSTDETHVNMTYTVPLLQPVTIGNVEATAIEGSDDVKLKLISTLQSVDGMYDAETSTITLTLNILSGTAVYEYTATRQ